MRQPDGWLADPDRSGNRSPQRRISGSGKSARPPFSPPTVR
jgi:hypothetical protein